MKKKKLAIVIVVIALCAVAAVVALWVSGAFRHASGPANGDSGGKEQEQIGYEGLNLVGETSFAAYENEVFTVPLPVVKNGDGETVPLEVTFTVTDSSYRAQGKDGNTVKLNVGMYTIKFILKDRTLDCKPLTASLEVTERGRRVLCDFSSEAEVASVTAQPTVNYGTNNGTKKFISSFGGRQGLLEYSVGNGATGVMSGNRDGFYVPFATPLAVGEIASVRFVAYVIGEQETRVAFGLKCDGDFGKDYFWFQTGKNTWQNYEGTTEKLVSKWQDDHDGETPVSIEGIYIRLPSASAGAKIYLDLIYCVNK